MMHSDLPLEQKASRTTQHRGWIESPAFDLPLLVLSPLLGLAIAIVGLHSAALMPLLLFGGSYFVGVPHYLATFAFFMGDENRAYSKNFWFLFWCTLLVVLAPLAVAQPRKVPRIGYLAAVSANADAPRTIARAPRGCGPR